MKARDLMTKEVITINEEATIDELCDVLQEQNINGLPVVDNEGNLKGVVTMEDIIYGTMGKTIQEKQAEKKKAVCLLKNGKVQKIESKAAIPQVRDIMTSPAIFVDEETPLMDICAILWNYRIHRIPVVREGKVTGIISSLDFCRAIAIGRIKA